MLYFIPAWYRENQWCENEQYWHMRRTRTEFDDTVKHIQLFHRSGAYPFQIMLLSFAPNFRHFLHRQSVFRAPYWSCFDAIQEVRKKKIRMFSVHNLYWPEHVEFRYTPFAMVAFLQGELYAQVEFGEDGNMIQIDMYQEGVLQRRNIYDDRGFVSSTILFEAGKPLYQDYLTDKGVWKIRHFAEDGHVEVNPKSPTYLLEYEGKEYVKTFSGKSYDSMEQVITEVLCAYLELTKDEDIFCVAMHELHTKAMALALENRKRVLSFYGDRYDVNRHPEDKEFILSADYVITDSQERYQHLQKNLGCTISRMTDITPFDSRVDFGISQQLNVQKIMVPVDGMNEERFAELIRQLGAYIPMNENARVHLFTRIADYDRKKLLLERTRQILREAGLPEGWAVESRGTNVAENMVDTMEEVPVRFYVEQCVSELSVSTCIREQRVMVDMRNMTEVYLRITGLSVGIPQIVYRETQFVEDGKNGRVIKDMKQLPEVLAYYLDNLTNWNEAVVYSYEHGKNYTTSVLLEKWKEVIDFVGCNQDITTGN